MIKTPETRRLICSVPVVIVLSNFVGWPALAAGALADGQLGLRRWGGYATNASTYDEAAARALARCNQVGPGCRVVAYFGRQCSAVAIQIGASGRGWAIRSTLGEAQSAVINRCASYGRPCEVKIATCDTVGLPGGNVPENQPAPPPPAPSPVPPTPAPWSPSRGCNLYPELC
jgi:hypothetical protein